MQPNPDSMVLASATPDGMPAARVVLCKKVIANPGYVVFFTNYESRKGRELAANARVAGVLHWDTMSRQVRIEGRVVLCPPEESDAYFASRAIDSRIGAWASLQSQPLDSLATLLKRVAVEAARHGTAPPRPPHWGGYHFWLEAVELWCEGAFRVHDRARWTRTLEPSGTAMPTRRARGRPRACIPDSVSARTPFISVCITPISPRCVRFYGALSLALLLAGVLLLVRGLKEYAGRLKSQ